MEDAALDLVLAKLDGVRRQGGYWMARCPAHDDHKASLSVKRGTEQPVIFKCHAGCERDAILDALNLSLDDVSKPRDQNGHGEWTPNGDAIAVYDYTDENGQLLFQVCRTLSKQFSQRRPDGIGAWKWRLGDTRRVPYRLPKVLAAVAEGRTVYIVEGEKDVHAIEAAGAVATTSPGGAGKWRDDYDHHFTGADVIIVADRDEPGRYHAEDVARHLRPIARSVTITEAAGGKDAADHLAAGHTLAELIPQQQQASHGLAVIDLEPWAEEVLPPTLICAGKLYLAAVHTLSGPPDSGKTTLACWWMLQTIRGGGTVLFLDEEGGRELVTEKFKALGAQAGERIAYVPFPARSWSIADLADLTDVMQARTPQLVAWDSSAAFLARAGLDENSAAEVTRFYSNVLAPCARVFGAAVIVIDHDTKNSEPSRYARGSGAKLAATDVAYKIEPIRPFSKTDEGLSKLTVTKDRRGWLDRHFEVTFTPDLTLSTLDVDITDKPAGEFRPTELMDRICRVLMKHPGLGFRDIKARVRGRDDTINAALAILIDEGTVIMRTGPRGAHLHELSGGNWETVT